MSTPDVGTVRDSEAAGGVAAAGRVARAFGDWYGRAPDGVWHAPGRVNLIGEHTDYNEGLVLPFALDRGVVAACALRGDGMLEIRSRQVPGGATTLRADSLVPRQVTGWIAYVAGVAWALREAGHAVTGATLAIDSDLPQGAGLSSSAALECAVALALTEASGVTLPRQDLAALAQRAENEFVGVPSGIMDQSASLLGRAGHALLLDCRSGETAEVPLAPADAGLGLVIVDTRARRALTDGRYSVRRLQCEQAADALGVRSLREVTGPAELSRLTDPVLRRRAKHVLGENHRVEQAVERLQSADLAGVGALMRESHTSLRDDFEISWPEADAAVAAAEAAGGLGARMMGGGFGGSVIALVAGDGAPVRAAVRAEFARHGWPEPMFLDAPPSDGARRLR